MALRALIVKIGADTQAIDKALQSVGSSTRDLAEGLKKLGDTEIGKKAQQDAERLNKSINELRASQERVASGARDAAVGIEQIGGAAKLTDTELKQINRTLQAGLSAYQALGREAPAELQKVADAVTKKLAPALSLNQIAGGLKTVGAGLTIGLSAPLLAMGVVATKAATDFESSFAGVRKTVDGVVDNFGKLTPSGQRLQQGFRDLAKELPVSVNELNRIGEAAGQLGIKQGDILQFSKTMATLGVTTNLSSDQAANAIARIQNIFGAAGKDTDRLASALVALGNAGASTESDIVEMSLRIAGAGQLAHLTQANILSIGNALSSVGVEAEAGGTAVQKVLLSMVTAVASGGDKLNKFAAAAGQTSAQFKQSFQTDAAGAFTAFVEGLGRSGDKAIGVLGGLGLQDQRLIRSFLSLANAGSLLRDSIDLGSKAWDENTAATKEAEQRFKTFDSQMQLLSNRANDVAIEVGTALLPVFTDLLDLLAPGLKIVAELAEKFADLPEGVRLAAVGIGAFAIAAGPALFVAGQLVSSFTTLLPLMESIGAVRIASGAGSLLGLLASPAGLAIGAALVGGGIAIHQFNEQLAATEARAAAAGKPLEAFGGAVQLTAENAEAASAAFEGPVLPLSLLSHSLKIVGSDSIALGKTLPAVGSQMDALGGVIAGIQHELAGLTSAQKNEITQAQALGVSTEKIAKALGISADAVSAFEKASTGAAKGGAKDLDHEFAVLDQSMRAFRLEGVEATKGIRALDLGYVKASDSTHLLQRATLALTSQQVGSALAFEDGKGEIHLYAEETLRSSDTVAKFRKHLLDLSDTTGKASGEMGEFRKEEEKAQRTTITASDALSSLSSAFSQIAQVSGDSFGGTIQVIGEVITGINAAVKATEAFKASQDAAGRASVSATVAAGASWFALASQISSAINAAVESGSVNDLMFSIGENFGVQITEGMATAFRAQADTLIRDFVRRVGSVNLEGNHPVIRGANGTPVSEKSFENAAAALNIRQIVDQGGGLNSENLPQLTTQFRSVFGFLQQGLITAAQATHVLDENFAAFAAAGTDHLGILNSQVREFIRLNDEAGTHSQAIDSFVTNQLTNQVVGGFHSALSPTSDASQRATADQQKLVELTNDLADANRDVADASDDQRDRITANIARIQRDIQTVTGDLQTQQAVIDTTQVHSEAAAQGIAGGIVAAFAGLQRSGSSVTEALAAVAPDVQALQEQLTRTGFDGGAAFQTLQGYVTLASDAIAGPALDSVGGLGQALVGLNNTGLLTQDTFTGITDQVTDTFNSLVSQGKDGDQALRLMQPTLQQIYELQQDFGFVVDDGTQALLDQAKTAGIVGDQQRPIQERQLAATQKIVDATDRIASALDRLIPAAAGAASGITDELSKIRTPDLSIKVSYDVDPLDPGAARKGASGAATGGLVTADGIQHFAAGGRVLPFLRGRGTDTVPAWLTPGEVVLNADQQKAVGDAMNARGGGGGVAISIQAWDGASVDRWLRAGGSRQLARAVVPEIPGALKSYGVA